MLSPKRARYLARAIHAANALRQKTDSLSSQAVEGSQLTSCPQDGSQSSQEPSRQDNDLDSRSQASYEHSNDDRQAVIHTIDLSENHSRHAEKIVKGFRQVRIFRSSSCLFGIEIGDLSCNSHFHLEKAMLTLKSGKGLYTNDIVFHVGDISSWIDEQVFNRRLGPDEKAFLSHIVLDMPSSFHHVEKAALVLHTNGKLLAFNPSITQISSIVTLVKQLNLPLVLESVLELGLHSGGREWDVRAVIPRALTRMARTATGEDDISSYADKDLDAGPVAGSASRDNQPTHAQVSGTEIICRPKFVHGVANGGGFLGVWRKMKY